MYENKKYFDGQWKRDADAPVHVLPEKISNIRVTMKIVEAGVFGHTSLPPPAPLLTKASSRGGGGYGGFRSHARCLLSKSRISNEVVVGWREWRMMRREEGKRANVVVTECDAVPRDCVAARGVPPPPPLAHKTLYFQRQSPGGQSKWWKKLFARVWAAYIPI